MKLPIMPDLPDEYIRYLYDNKDNIVFDERIFIKRLFANEQNPEILNELLSLNITNFNFPKRLLIDENELYLYLASIYIKNNQSFLEYVKKLSNREILLLYKKMLLNLKEAHQKDFNPYDIAFRNYLIDENHQPIFVDFDICFYKEQPTWNMTRQTLFNISEFSKDPFLLNTENLILNDKILLLSMLFTNLCPSNRYFLVLNHQEITEQLDILLNRYKIDPAIQEYLKDIILKKNPPQEDDYFIENLINPLLDNPPLLKQK